jgi:GNAT superfamily N-acetyltransferase
MRVGHLPDGDGSAVLAEILADLPAFWGERDIERGMVALHHPVWLRQFAPDAVVVREQDELLGYLMGTVTTRGLAYAHLIAVRVDSRRRGIGKLLYDAFFDDAQRRGARRVEAITTTTNTDSIAFHRRLGFSADVVPNYAGPDASRILFGRSLSPEGRGTQVNEPRDPVGHPAQNDPRSIDP